MQSSRHTIVASFKCTCKSKMGVVLRNLMFKHKKRLINVVLEITGHKSKAKTILKIHVRV